MQKTFPLMLFLHLLVISTHVLGTASKCPWDDNTLQKWGLKSTWSGGGVPKENDTVFIPAGKRILLDKPIPRLLTLTINGTLVWGNVGGIRMEASYIMVNGEFHIGSEDCTFEKSAEIFLYGKSNSQESSPDHGRKFIIAESGSKLEIHGKQKKSWTKLIATVSPATPGPCGIKYDSRNHYIRATHGIWMNVWNKDGTSLLFEAFDFRSKANRHIPAIVKKIKDLGNGKIVSAVVLKSIGSPTQVYEDLYLAIEGLGGNQIRNVRENEAYVLIAEKGKPTGAKEKHSKRLAGMKHALETSTTFVDGDLVYNAKSYASIGRPRSRPQFRVLHKNAAFPKLSFLHDVTTWETGDEVVVASTDYNWRQAEVKTIVDCGDCEPNQIRVKGDFRYSHFGEVTYGVDERGEVGLLTRNIHIEGELQDHCYSYTEREEEVCKMFGQKDTFGGHIKVEAGAWARIEGAQLIHMGQQSVKSRYPVHFHMADAVQGQYVRNNVIRDSNSRCITIHGTDYLEVSDNVCLNHFGHGIFVEDSAEQNNTIHRNLVIGTQMGSLLVSDRDKSLLSSYWITHPNNFITDNVAAGSDGVGFALVFSDRPLGPSLQRMKSRGLYRDKSTRYMRVAKFSKNVMHSNKNLGMWFDNRLSYGQLYGNVFVPENMKLTHNQYSPRDPPYPDGSLVETVLSELTFYKNEARNTWVRCGNIVIANSTFADSPVSYVAAHTVDGTYCKVRDSIFIGETDNKGEPFTYTFRGSMFNSKRPRHHFDRSIASGRPGQMTSAIQFYQGPTYLENCYFDQYRNRYYNDSFIETWGIRPLRPAAAITFHQNNHYMMVPRNGVKNLKFGFCDGREDSFKVMDGNASTPFWNVFDGTKSILIRDYDGSLTNSKDAVIVKDRPFFTGEKCMRKPDWGLSICPYKYASLTVRGRGGVLHNRYKGKTPVLISRDDHPNDVFTITGESGNRFILRVYKSYTVWFNSTLGQAPKEILFRPRYGLEKNEVIRLAVCLPKSTTSFSVYSSYPRLTPMRKKLPLWVDSLEELDSDTTMKAFYWDRANGYLYFKMSSSHSFTDPGQRCAGNFCVDMRIVRNDGGSQPAVCDSPVSPYYVKDRYRRPRSRRCRIDSPEGLGASIETGFQPASV